MKFRTLSIGEVENIHKALTDFAQETNDPIYPAGIKNRGNLESAVGRQLSGIEDRLFYDDPISNAATLLYGLCLNHAFHNGNKQTALVSCLTHLDGNDFIPDQVTHDEIYKFVVDLAAHELSNHSEFHRTLKQPRFRSIRELVSQGRHNSDLEIETVRCWLRSRVRRIDNKDRPITFRQFKKILTKFGCEVTAPDNNFIKILGLEVREQKYLLGIPIRTKVSRQTKQLSFPGDGFLVRIETIKDVRKQFGLTEENGVDSKKFYDQEAVVDFLLNEYRTLLRRLAKT